MPPRVILFGAFDRHNLGDLLFPHVAAALLPGRTLAFAGLAERDMRPFGGHAVEPLHRVAVNGPAALVHVGGETLTCTAWQAAVMLLLPGELAQPTIAYLASRPQARNAFVRDRLGTDAHAPYVLSPRAWPMLRPLIHAGVGGVALDRAEPVLRAEVLAALREADTVGVRDGRTLAQLESSGVAARLLPDPAVMVAELFGERVRARATAGKLARVRRAFPHGHLAVQFGAEFGDDRTLAALATQLHRAAAAHGLGVALFRAGAAPWHDTLDDLRRLAAQLPADAVRIFESLNLWDLCALIAASRGYCGSSLHGRIVATAFGLPCLNLRAPGVDAGTSKQAAYAATWDDSGGPAEVDVQDLADGLQAALAADPGRLRAQARRLAAAYRRGFAALWPGPA